MKKRFKIVLVVLSILFFVGSVLYFSTDKNVLADDLQKNISAENTEKSNDDLKYINDFTTRFNNIYFESDIYRNGFSIVQNQIHSIDHKEFGEIKLIPAVDPKYNLMTLFFSDDNGNIVFKTYELESNFLISGQFKQCAESVSTVSFTDLNNDGLDDVVLLYTCKNEDSKNTFYIGDVLFQNSKGFYEDRKISDKINKFDMNKNVNAIEDYVKDGKSTEFLYTSDTLKELTDHGFNIIDDQSFDVHFEKFGLVKVITGFYKMAGQNYLMIYLVNTNNKILWNFQPMQDHVNFFSVKACSFNDIDGDGLEDITILANYIDEDKDGDAIIKADYNIYYQKAGYFIEDIEFKKSYTCTNEDGLPDISQRARKFWRWN